jgi:hypothetical protein
MFIKQIVIEGVQSDVEIARTENGALITSGNRVLCEVLRSDFTENVAAKAHDAMVIIFGEVRDGADARKRVNATKAQIHEVLSAIEKVVGC